MEEINSEDNIASIRRPIRHGAALSLLLLLFVSIATWYSVEVPVGEGVDETAHFDYVRYVHANWRLPRQNMDGKPVEVWMGHHPPLYYALGALVITAINTDDRTVVLKPNPHFVWDEGGERGWNVMLPTPSTLPWTDTLLALHLLRFLSIGLGMIAIIFVYLGIQTLQPDRPWTPLGGAAVVGLNPSFIYMASTIHHDVLLVALYAAGLYWCVRYSRRPISWQSLIVIGLLIGAASLTKVSGITLAPIVVMVLLLRKHHTDEWHQRFRQVGLVILVALVVAGWWFVRNQLLYGDPIGWQMFRSVYHRNFRTTPFTWGIFVQEFLAQIGRTFWGAFGFMHIVLPSWLRLICWAVTTFALLGWFSFAAQWFLHKRLRWNRDTSLAWLALLAAFALLFLSFVRFAMSSLGAGHGRYLFPVGLTIGALIITGINGYGRWRFQRQWSLLLLIGLSVYAIIAPIFYVWPKYSLPQSVDSETLASAKPLHFVFDQGIELVAVATSSPVVIPGQGLDIVTYWAAHPQSHEYADAYVYLSLVDENNSFLAFSSFWPEISTTPAIWGNQVFANHQSVYIPPNLISGKLKVQIQVAEFIDGPLLELQNQQKGETSVTIDELLALGSLEPVAKSAPPGEQRAETFAKTIRLLSVSVPKTARGGDVLPIGLYWEALTPVEEDYTVFVHILNNADEIVAQMDSPPGGGTVSTSTWPPGQVFRDIYAVPLPTTLPPGQYHVRLGMYTWPDLTRQPIFRGDTAIGDSIVVSEFEVVE